MESQDFNLTSAWVSFYLAVWFVQNVEASFDFLFGQREWPSCLERTIMLIDPNEPMDRAR